jgi:SAM-dependent methyltransferase
VWPANAVAGAVVTLADWFALPVCDAAFDVVIGDGSVNTLRYPDGFAALARETRRVLKDGGVLAIRAFCRPANPETVDAIFKDLFERRIGNIDIFNWRLAMALHRGLAAGTRFGDLWEAWHPRVPDSAGLMRSLGWPLEAPVEFIEAMRGFDGRMVFPTVAELSESLAGEFRQTACHFPDYETGDRYPTFVFEPNPRAGGRGR